MVFSRLQAKLLRFRDYRVLLGVVHLRKLSAFVQIAKNSLFCFCNFTMLAKAGKKNLLKLTEHSELNSFTNMAAEIDIDALKIQEQIKTKCGWKLTKTCEQAASTQKLLILVKRKCIPWVHLSIIFVKLNCGTNLDIGSLILDWDVLNAKI